MSKISNIILPISLKNPSVMHYIQAMQYPFSRHTRRGLQSCSFRLSSIIISESAREAPRWHRYYRLRNNCNFSIDIQKDSGDNTSPFPPNEKLTLKQLVRPFLMKFHPDRQGADAVNAPTAREVNMKALQTLNGMIDTVDQIFMRAAEPTKSISAGRIELQPSYIIEFLVQSGNSDGRRAVKRPKEELVASRRSVELSFDEKDINSVQMVDAKTGKFSFRAANTIRIKAMKEIVKLLRVAGLNVSSEHKSQIEQASGRLLDELDLASEERGVSGRNFQYKRRPKSEYEKSRERYMNTVDWKKHKVMYEDALRDAERDIATEGLMTMSDERKKRFVSGIISRIRIFDGLFDDPILKETQASYHHNIKLDKSLEPLQQLIAMRRISLLFNDNFQDLEMEDMGRVWESMTIVLVAERKGQNVIKGVPYSRLKRLKRGRESGFKFCYHSDDNITVYVPIDFQDEELIKEMKAHLCDFHALCMAEDGFLDFFPPIYADFKGHPTIE